MSTVSIADIIWPASCEKTPPFRYGVLLPKIEYSPITEAKMGQSIALLIYIADQAQLKTVIIYPVLPLDHHEIITST